MERLILIVEDEKPIADILKFNLQKEGYKTIEALDGEAGLNLALTKNPDLVLLDVMLPKLDGFGVCKKIREKSQVPVIILTARADELEKVLGLELGADDYITKPFSIREVMARVKANIRRTVDADAESKKALIIGRFTLDDERYEVKKDENLLDLTIREFELIRFLATQPDKIFSREQLLEHVWGYEYYGDVRTVDVTVRRLREKVEDNPSKPDYIITKRGVGYYFKKANV